MQDLFPDLGMGADIGKLVAVERKVGREIDAIVTTDTVGFERLGHRLARLTVEQRAAGLGANQDDRRPEDSDSRNRTDDPIP